MLGYALTTALKESKDLRSLLRARVMRPIGVPDAQWSVGYEQTFNVDGLPLIATWGGGSFTPRATARVGRLMLRKGNWEGQQLIASAAVEQTTMDAGTPANGQRERAVLSVPLGPLPDSRLALEPASVRVGDVVGTGRKDVEDQPSVRCEVLRDGAQRGPAVAVGLHVQE